MLYYKIGTRKVAQKEVQEDPQYIISYNLYVSQNTNKEKTLDYLNTS